MALISRLAAILHIYVHNATSLSILGAESTGELNNETGFALHALLVEPHKVRHVEPNA